MSGNFTPAEIATAERMSMPVEEIHTILNVYEQESAKLARERREQRSKDFAAKNSHP